MEQIKIKCSMCYQSQKEILYKSKYYLPPEIWTKILNFYTYRSCDLCLDKICEEHILIAEMNCNYYKIHRKMFQDKEFICNFCFINNLAGYI
jgi:hypothetical protein